MCGRYVSPDEAAIERQWHVGRQNNNPFPRRFNVVPTTDIPILRHAPEFGGLELVQARWGFIPLWWKEEKPPTNAINARSEEAAAKPMWRDAYRHSRCLIPAVGWYEWQAVKRPDPRTGVLKTYKLPHYIFSPDKRLVCFAGLMSESDDGELSCAILTRDASPSVADVHDRMPVVLPDETHSAWLDPASNDATNVGAMIRERARTDFEHYPVSTRLNAAKTDDEDLIKRV